MAFEESRIEVFLIQYLTSVTEYYSVLCKLFMLKFSCQ